MSVRFSRVTLLTNTKVAIFLVGGIPETQADFQGWTDFRDFIKDVRKDDAIVAHVESFLYGEEEPLDATPEEIACFYKRIETDYDFIEKQTMKIGEADTIIRLEK